MSLRFAVCLLLILPVSIAHGAQRIPLLIEDPAGIARDNEIVTSGIPLPVGAVAADASLRLIDGSGASIPMQVRTTATWRDGSSKWILIDFPCSVTAGATQGLFLEVGGVSQLAKAAREIQVEENADALWINTGRLKFSISKKRFGIFERVLLDGNLNGSFEPGEEIIGSGLRLSASLAREFAELQTAVQPPEEVTLEEPGPLRTVAKVSGWITDEQGRRLMKYLFRIHAYAGSSEVKVDCTAIQLADKIKMLWVKDLSVTLQRQLTAGGGYVFGGGARNHSGASGEPAVLLQLAESSYSVSHGNQQEKGLKAPGWVNVTNADGSGILMGTRFFWQQFPKAISVSQGGVRFGLYPGEAPQPMDMDQGLAKTFEFIIAFHNGLSATACASLVGAAEKPLFAIAAARWYCDSKVFGELESFDFDVFPDYETLTEASGDQFIKKMATGWRNWGDVYYGGEYKGTNSYMNLEYDVHHNFYCQFARTGLRKYLDTAITMARHQADIDTNHKTGWQWKHSPRHVEIQAEFGHTFTRGLLETYYLTGNRRCLEAAVELGDYFTKQIRNPRELGNERQIGWGLISLLPVYEATWDKKYFEAARATVERLLSGMDDRGKFDIRWDNRIAFFNGIGATGLIYYYRATGDERVAEAALRVIRRARGFYPEYAGRTLEALAWAYQRTHEPEYLDFMKLTWEETLAKVINWNVMELGAPTIFTVHALPFLARSGLLPKPEQPLGLSPEQFDSGNGLYAHHLPAGEAELYLKCTAEQAFSLVVIRKGAWKASGAATLYDPEGHVITKLEFPKEVALWQRQVLPVNPRLAGAYRLALRSQSVSNVKGGSFVTWDVVTSQPIRAVFSTTANEGIQFVTPYLYCMPVGDADTIQLDLSGEGEGFKKAVIYDPAGKVAGSMEAFIDLGDKGRYQYKASAKIPADQMNRLWRISLEDVSAVRISGVSPYFSTSEQGFFQPDRN